MMRITPESTDIELIDSYLNGDAAAFDILYERYKRRLYSYLNRLMPMRSALVDDVFQQTWGKVLGKLANYKHSEKFQAWLTRIAHNVAVDHFRKEKNEVLLEDTEKSKLFAAVGNEPWRDLENAELGKAIEDCLAKLTGDQREVFVLRQDDVSFKEIAKLQKCSINTALGRMQYALRNLRNCMGYWRP
jgi:RNA polymerase sigma-70 factor (ECF subfamily)